MKTNIIITGANGKMGKALIESIVKNENVKLVGALTQKNSADIGKDAGFSLGIKTGILIQDNLESIITEVESGVLIDFTRPEATLSYLTTCIEKNIKVVIGTTGFNDEEKILIQNASEKIGIVFSPNFSIGVNLTFALAGLASRTLNDQYDIEIIEAHHKHKVDAPSGTALRIGEVIAENKKLDLNSVAVYSRQGHTGERKPNTIGFSTIRAGDIIGDHTALFATTGERIEITHKASSRLTFAHGAVHAGIWLNNKKDLGLFSMQDVLNISHLA